jgi:hypothetical protein
MTQDAPSARLKRPSLFVIRGIIDTVDKSIDHRARFDELVKCTPELRNRGKMIQYLKLLVDELGWLERKEELRKTRWNPMSLNRRERRWTVAYYCITQLGRSFLELFPTPRVLEEDLPTPEQQEKNWKEWLGQG